MGTRHNDDLRMLEIQRLINDTYARIEVLDLTEERIVRPSTYVESILVDTLYMNAHRTLEEASNLEFETQFAYPHVPWSAIRETRNRFVREHGSVRPIVVWETVRDEFPTLLDMANDYIDQRGLRAAADSSA